eukprot:TRINITY_DN19274_c0_g1_i1.p1 TRINITY_DN19274_c0_g1~~TRINITY_DN19274_c0_g1_i1.p1  ORF type:complete len:154 (-),score=31.43 TRINITY_DN19274_c0_g1_i1:52-465(-)
MTEVCSQTLFHWKTDIEHRMELMENKLTHALHTQQRIASELLNSRSENLRISSEFSEKSQQYDILSVHSNLQQQQSLQTMQRQMEELDKYRMMYQALYQQHHTLLAQLQLPAPGFPSPTGYPPPNQGYIPIDAPPHT